MIRGIGALVVVLVFCIDLWHAEIVEQGSFQTSDVAAKMDSSSTLITAFITSKIESSWQNIVPPTRVKGDIDEFGLFEPASGSVDEDSVALSVRGGSNAAAIGVFMSFRGENGFTAANSLIVTTASSVLVLFDASMLIDITASCAVDFWAFSASCTYALAFNGC